MELSVEVYKHLSEFPTGVVLPQIGLHFDEFNLVVPDMVYISNERLKQILHDDRLCGAPELVVEILASDGLNQSRERVIKRQLYASREVQEYWIVDLAAKLIEIHTASDCGTFFFNDT